MSFAGAMTVFNDKLIVTASGLQTNSVAVWRGDGAKWKLLGSFESAAENWPEIHVLTAYGDQLIVGGLFSSVDNHFANCIARWDGSMWHNLGSGVDFHVFSLLTYHDDLLVGGAFSTAGGQTSHAIARWSGSAWLPIGKANGGIVFDLTLSDHLVYAGGLLYTSSGSSSMHGLDRWVDCCDEDSNFDGLINVDDLLAIINHWGPCPPQTLHCYADITGDSQVNIDDLLAVVGAWGRCVYEQ